MREIVVAYLILLFHPSLGVNALFTHFLFQNPTRLLSFCTSETLESDPFHDDKKPPPPSLLLIGLFIFLSFSTSVGVVISMGSKSHPFLF